MNSFTFNFNKMKKFFSKLVLFILPLFLYIIINLCYNNYTYRNESIDMGAIDDLIIGDSQLMTSMDTSLFNNAKNLCQSAEPLIVSYWKLKKIFKSNKPRQIYLGLSPNNISKYNDYKFSDKKWAQTMFSRIYPIHDLNSISNKIEIDFAKFYKVLFKQTAFYPKNIHSNYLGSFSKKSSSDVSNWELRIKQHFFHNEKVLGESIIAIAYLDSIIELCTEFETSLTLIGSPLHSNYFTNIPKPVLIEYYKIKEKLIKQGLCFIDKSNDNTYADSLFYDANHLNYVGANRFTNEVLELSKAFNENKLKL